MASLAAVAPANPVLIGGAATDNLRSPQTNLEGYYEKDTAVLGPRKRLVVSQSRRERVYKRTGDANVTFCGKGEAAE